MKVISIYIYRYIFQVSYLMLCISIALIMIGCSDNAFNSIVDENSFEARLEDARIALDEQNYTEAKEILTELLSDNPESDLVRQYLSNAWSGLAGLDVINLLEVIDKLDEAGDSGNIEMFGKVLGDENGTILREKVFDKVDRLNTAFITMDEIELLQTLSRDQVIQLGIVGATHMAFVIAEIVMNDQPQLTQITLTENGINELYDEVTPVFDGQEATDEMLEDISRDLFAIEAAVEELEKRDNNDIAEDLEDFINKIDPDQNGEITRDEMESYVESL